MPKVTSEAPRGLHFEALGVPKCAQKAHLAAQGGHFEGLGLPKSPQELHLVVAAYFSDIFFLRYSFSHFVLWVVTVCCCLPRLVSWNVDVFIHTQFV